MKSEGVWINVIPVRMFPVVNHCGGDKLKMKYPDFNAFAFST
jgi:hypothetical protein